MAAGLVASIIAFAVGAVLDFALTVNSDQHGFNVHTVGVRLRIVGAVGAVLSIIGFIAGWSRVATTRLRTITNIARRLGSPASMERCMAAEAVRRSKAYETGAAAPVFLL